MQALISAITNCSRGDAINWVEERGEEFSARDVIDACTEGLKGLGGRFERGEAYLPELMIGGKIFNEIFELVKPRLDAEGRESRNKGSVLLATVEGDLHDLGKNLVGLILSTAGFRVIDLGVNNSTERLIQAVEEKSPDIVGLSSLLTTTMLKMREFIEELKRRGMRETVKIMVGGAPVTQQWSDEIGADAYGSDAIDAQHKAVALMAGKEVNR